MQAEQVLINWAFLLYAGLTLLSQFSFLMLQIKLHDKGYKKLSNVAYACNLTCIPIAFYFTIMVFQ